MARMGRINFYGDLDEWEKLQRNIDCNRSKWLNEMIKKQNRCIDEVDEINLKIQSIENQEKTLAFDKSILIEQKKAILKQREINDKTFEVVENAMHTIREIVSNQGYIEDDRIKYVAKSHTLNPDVLFEQVEKEQIKHQDIEIQHHKIDYSSVGGKQRR